MTGREIADNLRHTKLRWGKGLTNFWSNPTELAFCVIAIKAIEHGVPEEFIKERPLSSAEYLPPDHTSEEFQAISLLYHKNDDLDFTKEDLIHWLEAPPQAEFNFPIEKVVEQFKARAREAGYLKD